MVTHEYSFCIDVTDRRLRENGSNAKALLDSATQDLLQQLKDLGLEPRQLSPILFSAAVDPVRFNDDDGDLMNEMDGLLNDRILKIRTGVSRVGGERTLPYHPDILKVMKEVPGFPDLPIHEKIRILQEGKLIS